MQQASADARRRKVGVDDDELVAVAHRRESMQQVGVQQWVNSLQHLCFHAPVRQPDDDLLLNDDREKQHRHGDDQRGSGERSPGELLEGQHVVHGRRQRARRAAGEHRTEHEIVPREDERQDRRAAR